MWNLRESRIRQFLWGRQNLKLARAKCPAGPTDNHQAGIENPDKLVGEVSRKPTPLTITTNCVAIVAKTYVVATKISVCADLSGKVAAYVWQVLQGFWGVA